MINPEFKKETDNLIEKFKTRGIKAVNGNVIVAKVKIDRVSAGGIVIADAHVDREDYKNGLARILALPPLTEDDAELKVGDYVVHSHEARYAVYPAALKEALDVTHVDDKFVFSVQDNEIIFTVPAEILN